MTRAMTRSGRYGGSEWWKSAKKSAGGNPETWNLHETTGGEKKNMKNG
jgi:hypothetical protein